MDEIPIQMMDRAVVGWNSRQEEVDQLKAEVEQLRAALTRIASINACDDPPCRHMGLADDIAVRAITDAPPPEHEPEMERL